MKNDGNITLITGNDTKMSENVNKFNKQVIEFINKKVSKEEYGKHEDDYQHRVSGGDINGIIFHTMRWRRCTGFLVIQTSKIKTRYLCYLEDAIKHNGQSFGTSPQSVSINQVKKYFIKKLKNVNNIDKNFGID